MNCVKHYRPPPWLKLAIILEAETTKQQCDRINELKLLNFYAKMYIHDTTKMQHLQTTTLTKTRKLNTTNYFIGKKHCKFLTNGNP